MVEMIFPTLLLFTLSFVLTIVQSVDFSRITLPKDSEFLNSTLDTTNKESFFTDYRRILNEDILLPPATRVEYRYNDTDTMAEILFFAKLTRTSNCRASYDKLDCPFCKEILPDAHVAVTYGKNPLGISGHISVSENNKAIYVVVRGASSLRNKITYGLNDMIQHPFIPKARVHRGMVLGLLSIQDTIMQTLDDQIKLHPDFEVIVAGHSFGAGVASLVAVDIHRRFPQLGSTRLKARLLGKPRVGDEHYVSYVADNNINLIRYVQFDDGTTHEPSLFKGYLHEGDEYWIKSFRHNEVVICPGPYETRNCSASLDVVGSLAHINYLGVNEGCEDDLHNLI